MFIALRTPKLFRSVRSDMFAIDARHMALLKECLTFPGFANYKHVTPPE